MATHPEYFEDWCCTLSSMAVEYHYVLSSKYSIVCLHGDDCKSKWLSSSVESSEIWTEIRFEAIDLGLIKI